MRTYLTRKPMYGYDKIPAGGHRFWEVPESKARSIYRCVRYFRKKTGIEIRAKLTDDGVFVWRAA
jgi:hypothetical protein